MNRFSKGFVSVVFCCSGLSTVVLAQDSERTLYSSDSVRPIEEIVVIGRAPEDYPAQVRRLEKEIKALFNANNESVEMDIVCRRVSFSHTFISRRVCEPRYLLNNRSGGVHYSRQSANYLFSELRRYHVNNFGTDDFSRTLISMINNNDEFFALVDEYSQLVWGREIERNKVESSALSG